MYLLKTRHFHEINSNSNICYIIEVININFKKSTGQGFNQPIKWGIEWGYTQPMNANKISDRDRAYISLGNDIKETRRGTDKK